jgi:hypothetical protein
MKRSAALAALLLVAACGSGSTAATIPTPSPSPTAHDVASLPVSTSPSPGTGSRSPIPSPSPVPEISCKTGSSAGAMVMIGGYYAPAELIYDVTDPLHPRLLCTISNTTAHLFTGDTFAYLKPVSSSETDVILHSIGSGNESKAASFPANPVDPLRGTATTLAWTPDGSVLAYAVLDEQSYTVHVWLYAQNRLREVHAYGLGIGDCICRFGLPPPVLSLSPDGEYLADGQLAGKGSTPITVIRVSDGAVVFTADPSDYAALWSRGGHTLYLIGNTNGSWTPETGFAALPGGSWEFLQGISPDGTLAAYTAYIDPNTDAQPRVFTYDLKAGTARLLVDKLRTQVLFVKDGWVWYLEERACTAADQCLGGTVPTGGVFAMQLSTGVEQAVTFGAGESPADRGNYWTVVTPGEFWPNS